MASILIFAGNDIQKTIRIEINKLEVLGVKSCGLINRERVDMIKCPIAIGREIIDDSPKTRASKRQIIVAVCVDVPGCDRPSARLRKDDSFRDIKVIISEVPN